MANLTSRLSKHSDLLLAACLVGTLAVMVVPLSPFVIDILLALGIATSVVLLLTSVYTTKVLDFSLFPTLLLVTTLFRLSVNVATTRAILLRGGPNGPEAAGQLIHSFGQFVVGGNYAVGIVIFTILVIINFVVITKGAGRVAEVAARFTLDAMPGKQMAIDADLNAGVIDEKESRRRREEISQEADFYGAMDGASKFVRGDAIAGMLIVGVNIFGGIIIGTLQRGMSIGDAAKTFTLLTIGEGLLTQIPALIISTAAGIVVTRSGGGSHLGSEMGRQLFSNHRSMFAASGVMSFLGLVPGLPFLPFAVLGSGLGYIGYQIYSKRSQEEKKDNAEKEREKLKPKPEKLESLLGVDLLELEVGYGLINIVDVEQKGDLLERISNIRKQFALDLGIIVPPLRIRDNLELKPGDYQVLLKGVAIGSGSLMVAHLLAMDPGNTTKRIAGIKTKEPAFGLDAIWISEHQKEEATFAGYTVVDLSTVVATHLTELVRQHGHELFGRQELQVLLDQLKETAPKVIEDLIPNLLPVGTVLKVLKNLLKEAVSIRDLKSILEALGEYASTSKDPVLLTEFVRTNLARTITKKLVGGDGNLTLLTLEKDIEETVASGIIQTEHGPQLSLDPEFVRKFIGELNQKVSQMAQESAQAIVLCSPMIRFHLKTLVDRFIPNIVILSHNEITSNVNIRALDTVRISHAY